MGRLSLARRLGLARTHPRAQLGAHARAHNWARTTGRARERASKPRRRLTHAPDGFAQDLQPRAHPARLQRPVHGRRVGTVPPFASVGGRSGEVGSPGRVRWEDAWVLGCIVGGSGVEWDTRMVMHRGTRVAGLLPPSHPGSKFGHPNEIP